LVRAGTKVYGSRACNAGTTIYVFRGIDAGTLADGFNVTYAGDYSLLLPF
jgi:hypothetical protein